MADDKLLVSVELGATLPFDDKTFGNVKPTIRLQNIDPYGDVEQQIKDGLNTAHKAFVAIDEDLEPLIANMLMPTLGKPGFGDRMKRLEASVQVLKKNDQRFLARMKEMMDKLGMTVSDKVKAKAEEAGGGTTEA